MTGAVFTREEEAMVEDWRDFDVRARCEALVRMPVFEPQNRLEELVEEALSLYQDVIREFLAEILVVLARGDFKRVQALLQHFQTHDRYRMLTVAERQDLLEGIADDAYGRIEADDPAQNFHPDDIADAEQWTAERQDASRIVWEILRGSDVPEAGGG